MFIHKSKKINVLALLLLCLLASCNKNADKSLVAPKADSQLEFIVAEQIGGSADNMAKLRASSLSGGTPQQREEDIQHHFIENGAFRVTTSLVTESSASSFSKPTVNNKVGARMSALATGPSTSLLAKNTKYRVVLYDRATTPSTYVSSTLGIAGQKLYVDVEKGKNYDWAVFSFNDQNDPGDAYSTIDSDNRDLLYAKGTTGVIPGVSGDGKDIVQPIQVTLRHKLAAVSVKVTAKNYPAKITQISASLGSASYFARTRMNIKTGEFVAQNTQMNMDQVIPFNSADGDSSRVRDYYTAKFDAISDFFVTLNRLTVLPASGRPSSLSSPVRYSWNNNIVPAPGKRVTATINIQPVRDVSGDKFKILSVGPQFGISQTEIQSGIWIALTSRRNFGPTGTYPTTNLNWSITRRQYGWDDILTGGYKIIFASYQASTLGLNETTARQLIQFVENGGTLIWYTGVPMWANDQRVWKHFAGAGARAVDYHSVGVPLNQHPVLNGVFGDARGTTFGNPGVDGYGMVDLGNEAEVLATSRPQPGVATPRPPIAVVWKAKDKDFYFIGNVGMQSHSINSGANSSQNPFLLTLDSRPRIGPWNTINPWNDHNEDVSNSVMVMNIITKAIDKAMDSKK